MDVSVPVTKSKEKKKKKVSPLKPSPRIPYCSISENSSVSHNLNPHPPSSTPTSGYSRAAKTHKKGAAISDMNSIGMSSKPVASKVGNGLNVELFELSDIGTASMLQEIQMKEEVGYPQQSYVNMNNRMAQEVKLSKPCLNLDII